MSSLTTIMVIVLVLAIVGAAALAQDEPKVTPKALVNIDPKALSAGNTQFGLDLYGELAAKEKGNVFFSPYSISEALSMTYLGAAGQTRKEMQKALHVPVGHLNEDRTVVWTDDELAAAYKDFHGKLSNSRGKFQLHVANALWGAQGAAFKPDFLKIVDEQFGGKLESLDFSKSDQAAKTINDWVASQTQDKIKDLVPASALDANTRLVLTNAIYFKAPWTNQFKAQLTKDHDFFLDGEKTTQAKMMEQTTHFGYNELDGVKVLEMGYEGSHVSMVILLPDKKEGLGALEEALAVKPKEGSPLDAYLKDMKSSKVHVVLPKFKFTCKFSLGDVLQKLGMKLAFDSGNADFSGMSEKEKLFISAVLHKAFVDVNEEGTEAAAATAIIMSLGAMPHAEEPKQFVADHPFLFIIRDSQTGSVLFMGRVNDPTK